MDFKDRLASLIEQKGISQRQLAIKLGITPQSVQQWVRGTARPSGDKIQSIAEYFDVTPSYLMFGDTSMNSSEIDEETVSIPVLNVEGSCGVNPSMAGVIEMVKLLRVAKEWLIQRVGNINFRKLHIITASGDSMSPTFNDGDFVIVDTSKREVLSDGVYAVQSGGGIFIKRIQRELDGGVTLLSDNPKYRPQPVPVEDIETMSIIGKCVIALTSKEI